MMKKLLKKADSDTSRTARPLKASKNPSASIQVEPSINQEQKAPADSSVGTASTGAPESAAKAKPRDVQPTVTPDRTSSPDGTNSPDRASADASAKGPATSGDSKPAQPVSDADTNAKSAPASSVLGEGLVVEGELHASENLTILGEVSGVIHHQSDLLTVGSTGVVSAQIHAHSLVVEGRIEGDINCSVAVKITETATVVGNITTARLSIADGATFSGKIDMT